MGKLKKTALVAGITVLLMSAAAGTAYALLNARTVTVANQFAGAVVNIGVVEQFTDDNTIIYEDMGEQLTDNINDVYDRIKDDNTTRTKEIAVKNINSEEYPTTDTYVRVRLVPMIIYDDSKENIKAGIAGNIAAVDMRGKVSYSYANELKSKADVDKAMKDNEDLTGSWFYMDNSSSDDNERYYYYSVPVAPGDMTSRLINNVTYAGDIPENAHFELKVLAEGVSSKQEDSRADWGL
ncbi:MAG: hypothetical protein ACLTTL_05730 [Lachnospira pectinoschiza]